MHEAALEEIKRSNIEQEPHYAERSDFRAPRAHKRDALLHREYCTSPQVANPARGGANATHRSASPAANEGAGLIRAGSIRAPCKQEGEPTKGPG